MLVSDAATKVDVPHEAGHHFLIRKLSWKEVEEARSTQTAKARDEAKAWGAEMLSALTNKEPSTGDAVADADAEVEKQQAIDALMERQAYKEGQFDRDTLFLYGIADWSYEAPARPDSFVLLDEQTAKWAAQAIIDHTKPPTEDEAGNS